MQRDDIIALAAYCGAQIVNSDRAVLTVQALERFAQAIEAKERDRCANIAYAWGHADIEKAIRATSFTGAQATQQEGQHG
jgi:hypothetical protein